MAVGDINKFQGHRGRAFHGIFITASRTEAAMTAEGNEFQFAAVRAAIHGSAEGRVAAVEHLINIFHLSFSGMESIYNFFIMVFKNSL